MDVKRAIIGLMQAERIKSELIIAFKLLGVLSTLKDIEAAGGEKIVVTFLEAVTVETRIAQNATKSRQLSEVAMKIMETIGSVRLRKFEEGNKALSEAITNVTTCCQEAMQTLVDNDLI